ncbi:MAG: 50S ribosomal protein L17 [candidate division Zixibacteria bacterium]|nr:50S ribosomal protein L17 [candidate division Zixibacteria bacterium]
MRHNRTVKKLGVTASHRKAMMRNMVTSLLEHGRITTTHVKAKVLKSYADRLVNLAKTDTVHTRRMAAESIKDKEVIKKLFTKISPEFSDRNGGYTRIIKKGFRKGDNAAVSIIELVNYEPVSKDDEKDKKKGSDKSKK